MRLIQLEQRPAAQCELTRWDTHHAYATICRCFAAGLLQNVCYLQPAVGIVVFGNYCLAIAYLSLRKLLVLIGRQCPTALACVFAGKQ